MSGGGDTRVSIPNNFRKIIQELKKTIGLKHSDEFLYTTLKDCGMDPKEAGRRLKMIHDVKEIAGKHSVDDVYTMLKECNMDPNEATQRLLYIDTFHEVKRKHDRRKSISSETSEDYKRTQSQSNQRRRNSSSGKESGVTNRQERVSRLTIPVHSGKEHNVVNGNGTLAISNGSYSHKLAPQSSADVVVTSKKNTCAVGTIQCEIVKRSSSSSKSNAGIKLSADQVIEKAKDFENTRKLESDLDEKIQMSESLCDSSEGVSPNQDNQPPQSLHEPLKEVMETISITKTQSIPEEKSELKISPRKPDATLSSHQTVIFPDHIQVPENFKNHFIFGSLNAALDDSQTESCQRKDEIVPVPEPSLKDNISSESDPTLKHEETKVEMMPPLVGFQNPVLQRDYGFGYMQHLMGPQFAPLDSGSSVIPSGLGQSQSQTPTTQAQQNSIPLSPPLFPYFRQPYANYIPYINPYFPHLYLPQNAHLSNHGLIPHQPPPTTGVKLPFPPQFKQENLTPNPNQDVTLSQEEDNIPQGGEDEQVWGHTHVPNYYYNFPPQGHPVAFPPYHSSQPLMNQTTDGTDEKPPQHREAS